MASINNCIFMLPLHAVCQEVLCFLPVRVYVRPSCVRDRKTDRQIIFDMR